VPTAPAERGAGAVTSVSPTKAEVRAAETPSASASPCDQTTSVRAPASAETPTAPASSSA